MSDGTHQEEETCLVPREEVVTEPHDPCRLVSFLQLKPIVPPAPAALGTPNSALRSAPGMGFKPPRPPTPPPALPALPMSGRPPLLLGRPPDGLARLRPRRELTFLLGLEATLGISPKSLGS
eukprot:764789-Hanusia_phi.AAC.1